MIFRSIDITVNERKNLIMLACIMAGFLGLYFPFLKTMAATWSDNPNYSHGYLIPIISIYLIYSLKNRIMAVEPSSSIWGLILIILALLQLIIAKIGMEYFLQRTSIIVLMYGISLYFYGSKITKLTAIPILYLIFMVPLPAIIWNQIALPLQLLSSYLTENVIRIVGLPIFREGNILHLPQITLEVVDACSGIRSLTTMMALSLPFAFFLKLGMVRKVALFLSAVPIAIFANIVRLTATAFLSELYGKQFAEGFLHEFSGMVTFVMGLGLLFIMKILLSFKAAK